MTYAIGTKMVSKSERETGIEEGYEFIVNRIEGELYIDRAGFAVEPDWIEDGFVEVVE